MTAMLKVFRLSLCSSLMAVNSGSRLLVDDDGNVEDGSLGDAAVLSEDEVRHISKTTISTTLKCELIDGRTLSSLVTLLQRILSTLSEARLASSHRAATCDALCGFLKHGSTSKNENLRDFCLSYDTWRRLFCMYIEQYNDSQSKPMKQVLEQLCKLLNRQDEPGRQACRDKCIQFAVKACIRYVKAIAHKPELSSLSHARPAMLVLDLLLTKHVVDSRAVLAAFNAENNVSSPNEALQQARDFMVNILEWSQNIDMAPACGKLLHSFYTDFFTQRAGASTSADLRKQPSWIEVVQDFMEAHPLASTSVEHYILPNLIRSDPKSSLTFIDGFDNNIDPYSTRTLRSNMEIRLALLILKVMESFQLSSSRSLGSYQRQYDQGALSPAQEFASKHLEDGADEVRLSALEVFTCSSAITVPFAAPALQRLRECLPYLHVEGNANARSVLLNILKRLLSRIVATLGRLKKTWGEIERFEGAATKLNGNGVRSYQDSINIHESFLRWYVTFLVRELAVTASYQRHIIVLKTVKLLFDLRVHETLKVGGQDM